MSRLFFKIKCFIHLLLWYVGIQTRFNAGIFRDEDGKLKITYQINPRIFGFWQCVNCSTGMDFTDLSTSPEKFTFLLSDFSEWRWNGDFWEHKCCKDPQTGYAPAVRPVGVTK